MDNADILDQLVFVGTGNRIFKSFINKHELKFPNDKIKAVVLSMCPNLLEIAICAKYGICTPLQNSANNTVNIQRTSGRYTLIISAVGFIINIAVRYKTFIGISRNYKILLKEK